MAAQKTFMSQHSFMLKLNETGTSRHKSIVKSKLSVGVIHNCAQAPFSVVAGEPWVLGMCSPATIECTSPVPKAFLLSSDQWGQSDSRADRATALYVAELGTIPSIPYGP